MQEQRSPKPKRSDMSTSTIIEDDYNRTWFDEAADRWGAEPLNNLGTFYRSSKYEEDPSSSIDLDLFEATAVSIDPENYPGKNAWSGVFTKIIAYNDAEVNLYGDYGGGHIGLTSEGNVVNVRDVGGNQVLGRVVFGNSRPRMRVARRNQPKVARAEEIMTAVLSKYDQEESVKAIKKLRGYTEDYSRTLVEGHGIVASLNRKAPYYRGDRFDFRYPHIILPLREMDDDATLHITGGQSRLYGGSARYLFLKQSTKNAKKANVLRTPPFSVHEPVTKPLNEDMIVITEGPLKAIAIAEKWGYRTISAQGIQHMENGKKLAKLLKKFDCNRVALIPDKDISENEKHAGHARNLVIAAMSLEDTGILPTFITWDDLRYKGIDDAIMAGYEKFVEVRPSTWYKSLPKRSKNYLARSKANVDFMGRVMEYYAKDGLKFREQYSLMPLVDGDAEDRAITNARMQMKDLDEIWTKVQNIGLNKTLILELPTGSGKSHTLGEYLNNPPEGWNQFKQIVYTTHNIYEESVPSLKTIPQHHGRTSTGRKRDENGKVHKVLPGEQADPDLKANCIQADEIQHLLSQGNTEVVARIEQHCALKDVCPYKRRKEWVEAERVKRMSWAGMDIKENSLILVDEESSLDQHTTTTFTIQELSEMSEMLDTIRNYKLRELEDAPREKIHNTLLLFEAIEDTLHTLLQMIVPAEDNDYISHDQIIGSLKLKLAAKGITNKDLKAARKAEAHMTRLSREDYAFIFKNTQDDQEYEITADNLSPKQERYFEEVAKDPALWAQMIREAKPRFQVYNQFFLISARLKKIKELLTEPGCTLLFNPKTKQLDIKKPNKLYHAVITRTYSQKMQYKLEEGEELTEEDKKYLRLEETTSTVIADASPVKSIMSSSGNIEYYTTKLDIPDNVILEQIIDFPNLPSSAPLQARMRRSLMLDKMIRVRDDIIPEETGIITCKQDLVDPETRHIYEANSAITGYWFVDNRGSNKFYEKRIKTLIIVGSPTANRNALRVEANSLNVQHNVQLDDESTLVKRSVSEDIMMVRQEDKHPFTRNLMRFTEVSEILQAFGRTRSNRQKDTRFRVIFLSPTPIQAAIPYSVSITSIQEYVPVEELKELAPEYTLNKARRAIEKISLQRAEKAAASFVDMKNDMEDYIEYGYSDEETLKRVQEDYRYKIDKLENIAPQVLENLYGKQYREPLELSWSDLSDEYKAVVLRKVLASSGHRVEVAKSLLLKPSVVRSVERRLTNMSASKIDEVLDSISALDIEEENKTEYIAREFDLGEEAVTGIAGLDEEYRGMGWSLNPNRNAIYLRETLHAYEKAREYMKRAKSLRKDALKYRGKDTMPPMAVDIETYDPSQMNKVIPSEKDQKINKEGPDPKRDVIRLISVRIGYESMETLTFDLRHIRREYQIKIVKMLMEWPTWVGHNIAFDIEFLMEKFPEIPKRDFTRILMLDTMDMDRILTPEYAPSEENFRGRKRNLAVVVKDWLSKDLLSKDMQKSNWDLDPLTARQIKYSAMDVYILPTLVRVMTMADKQIRQNQEAYTDTTLRLVKDLFDMDDKQAHKMLETTMPYASPWMWVEGLFKPVLMKSARTGVRLNRKIIEEKVAKYEDLEYRTGQKILEYMNVKNPVTLKTKVDSSALFSEPKRFKATKTRGVQRAKYIEALGYELPKTDKGNPQATKDAVKIALGEDHELYQMINENESAQSRVTKLKELLGAAKDGDIIYPKFEQMQAQTGRLSARKPAIMNILPEVREAFIPREDDHILIDIDFSQEELRVAAAISGDEVMMNAYRNGEDLHTLTAANLNEVPLSQVTKEMRKAAKAANFGLLYGMGWRTFKDYAEKNYGIKYTEEEARTVRNKFYDTYPGIKNLVHTVYDMLNEETINETLPAHLYMKNGFVVGRSRAGRGMVSNKPNDVLNFPVQGTGADILKLSAVKFNLELNKRGWDEDVHILNYVHDELLISCPRYIADEVQGVLAKAMEEAAALLVTEVPIAVEGEKGATWAEIH